MSVADWFVDHTDSETWNQSQNRGLRPYTRQFLNTKSRRIGLRWGRRTGKTFALAARIAIELARPVVEQRKSILVLTPQKTHCSCLFDQALLLAKGLGANLSRILRGAPMRLESPSARVTMDSSIAHACGMDADIIIADEADYINDNVLTNVVNPILYTRPDIVLICAGTPSGTSGTWFQKFCLDPDTSELWVTSTSIPSFDEKFWLPDMPLELFDREILARFSNR